MYQIYYLIYKFLMIFIDFNFKLLINYNLKVNNNKNFKKMVFLWYLNEHDIIRYYNNNIIIIYNYIFKINNKTQLI